MVEILFVLGLVGLLVVYTFEYLASLAAAPTLLTAACLVPLLAVWDYLHAVHVMHLEGAHVRRGESRRRAPVPPERFYWLLNACRLRRQILWLAPIAILAWALALRCPAAMSLEPEDLAGWGFGAISIVATARLGARSILYWRASQWFDQMRPGVVGLYRRTMYRLSENPEFLGEENPRRRERENSIY
jgi:hypothetical protein